MSTRRRFFRVGLGAAALLALPRVAAAANTQVLASFDATQAEVGEVVYLEVKVTSDGRELSRPRFVALDNLTIESRGRSRSSSASFGAGGSRRSTTFTFTYAIACQAPGTYALTVDVDVDGEIHRPASPPTLKVVTLADPSPESGKAGDTPPLTEDPVTVWPVVDRAEAYVGEQIVYELQVWERQRQNLAFVTAPTFKDFWSEDLDTPTNARPMRRMIANVPHHMQVSMRRSLFPQKSGTLTIGGPKLQSQPRTNLFFGGGQSARPRTYSGRSLAIEIKPLPAQGQPPSFPANNVGKYALEAEVDRSEIRQGEAVRVTVTLSGVGNIPLVQLPEWPEFAGARTYEPKPQTPALDTSGPRLTGSRGYTMLIIADEPGELIIPAFELPYFDPEAGAYAVAKTEALTLTVAPNSKAQAGGDEPTAKGGAGAGKRDADARNDEVLAEPIAADQLPHVTPRSPWLDHARWRKAMIAAPALLAAGWLGGRLVQRFGPDEAGRARRSALALRRTTLAQASQAVETGEDFYAHLTTLLQAVAIDRAGPRGVGLTRGRLMELLGEGGVEAQSVEALRGLLDACDAARFGAGAGDAGSRRAHLEATQTLIADSCWRPQ